MSEAHPAFAPAPDVVIRHLNSEAVVLDLSTGTYFGLNEVGARMWQLIEQYGTPREVLEALAQEFDAPVERLGVDLREFLALLVSKVCCAPCRPRSTSSEKPRSLRNAGCLTDLREER